MSKVISIRLTEEDYRLLASRAVRQGQSTTEYVKYLLLRKHTRNEAPEPKETIPDDTPGTKEIDTAAVL